MNRLRLNWFSPLPPAHTGIGEYTAFLLPSLLRRCDLTLWTDQETWHADLEKFAPVRRYSPDDPPWRDLHRAEACVYHLGNNAACHANIFRMSRRLPGVIELHDLCLQEFFAGLYRDRLNDPSGYIDLMDKWYGAEGRLAAQDLCAGRRKAADLAELFPLVEPAIEGALGVIVHNQDGARRLSQPGHPPIRFTPLPRAAAPYQPRNIEYAIKRLTTWRLLAFGHLGANRRLDRFLEAWGTLPSLERDRFNLDVCGEIWNMDAVAAAIHRNKLEAQVTLHGYTPEPDLVSFIRRAHLAVNLRFPTMGEASGSQLWLFECGVPTLVTRIGWYAALPENIVAFVDPQNEIADIQRHLRAFLHAPAQYAEMGRRGRDLLDSRHTPAQYADALCDFCRSVAGRGDNWAEQYLADRAGQAMSPWTPPIPVPSLFQTAGQSIRDLCPRRIKD
jgi:glycosyltransferase involved in cell wall biosynthesis